MDEVLLGTYASVSHSVTDLKSFTEYLLCVRSSIAKLGYRAEVGEAERMGQ